MENDFITSKRMAPKPEKNPHHRRNQKPYLPTEKGGLWIVYINRQTRLPVCKVPDKVSAWMGFYRNAERVRALAAEGLTDAQIKKAVEADYRAFRDAELPKTVLLKSLKASMKKSLAYERRGWNTWPDEAMDVEGHPELSAYAFDPTPKVKRPRS